MGEANQSQRPRGPEVDPWGRNRVVHVDCRSWAGWPEQPDMVDTDPPLDDMLAYVGPASWARRRLRAGGLLLAQCGIRPLDEVLQLGRQEA